MAEMEIGGKPDLRHGNTLQQYGSLEFVVILHARRSRGNGSL